MNDSGDEDKSNLMSVSVIICAYTFDRWSDIQKTISSLLNQTVEFPEIIVVIDNNKPLFEAASKSFPNVVVVQNQGTPGIAGARNTGAAIAKGAIVAFIDDDATAEPGCLEQLLLAYEDASVVGVGGSIVPEWPGEPPAWFPDEFNWVVGCTYLGMAEEGAQVRNLIGANMSFRREVFEEIQFFSGLGYSNGKLVGGEETDFCIRLSSRMPHSRFIYQPRAEVRHRVSENRTTWKYFRKRCYSEGWMKAILSRRVGSASGLSSERTYTFRTLPAGIIRGMRSTLFQFDPTGLLRSVAIITGLFATVIGYALGTIVHFISSRRVQTGSETYQEPRIPI